MQELPAVMTLSEVAAYLKVGYGLARRMVASRKLPAFRIGDQWRVNREQLDEWMLNRQIDLNLERDTKWH